MEYVGNATKPVDPRVLARGIGDWPLKNSMNLFIRLRRNARIRVYGFLPHGETSRLSAESANFTQTGFFALLDPTYIVCSLGNRHSFDRATGKYENESLCIEYPFGNGRTSLSLSFSPYGNAEVCKRTI